MKHMIIATVLSLLPAAAGHAQSAFIDVETAKGLVGKPDVAFVFADSEKDYEKGHIPGSSEAYAHDLTLPPTT